MKLRIDRECLLRPLQQTVGVVERRQTLPILSNVLLTVEEATVTLTATDLETELSVAIPWPAEAPGATTLPARKLFDICRNLPEDASVEITTDDQDRAVLRSGRSRFTLATLPAEEFPRIAPEGEESQVRLPQQRLRRLLEKTHFAMAQQDVRYYLNGLLFELSQQEGVRTVATDGHRLSLCQASDHATDTDRQVILPRKGVTELLRLLEDADQDAVVHLTDNHLRIDGDRWRFTSKLIDGRFPDYRRVIPGETERRAVCDRDALRQALVRASILSNEKYRGIRLQFEDNLLRVSSHNPEQEEAEEELEVEYRGDAFEVAFNASYLLDALGAIEGEVAELSLNDGSSGCLVRAPGDTESLYVIMPMRL